MIPNSLRSGMAFNSFYLASNHISWEELGLVLHS